MIRYYTQTRIVKSSGEVQEDWHDSCHGHKNFDTALVCHAQQDQINAGKMIEGKDPFLGMILKLQIESFRAEGLHCESRLVKRTTTDEVVDA